MEMKDRKEIKEIRWLFRFMKPHQIRWGVGFLFDILGTGIFQICNGIALEKIGSGLLQAENHLIIEGLSAITGGALVITMTGIVFWMCYGVSIAGMRKSLKTFFFHKINSRESDAAGDSSAKLLTLLNQDIEMSISIFGEEFRPLVYGMGTSIIAITAIFLTNFWIGMVCLVTFLANILVTLYYKPKQEKAVNERQNALGNLNEEYKALFDGGAVLRSSNVIEKPMGWIGEATARIRSVKKKEQRIMTRQNMIIQLLLNLNNVIPMTLGVYLCAIGKLEIGKVFFLVQMSIQFIFDYQLMGPALTSISKAFANVGRLYEFSLEAEEQSRYGNESVKTDSETALEFETVNVSYQGKQVLAIDHMQIPRNKMVAVIGESGSGKSTFLKVILQLVTWTGSMKVFGAEPARYELSELRGLFSYIEQDPQIFSASIFDNISYGKHGASEAEIYQAASDAGVSEFAEKLPEGYETLIGENGAFLSGGECQRIAIARALLKDAPILVMDEATSALDFKSEAIIQQTIERMRGNHTIIVAAHRLNTIETADYIIKLKVGEIAESGLSRDLLLKRAKSS